MKLAESYYLGRLDVKKAIYQSQTRNEMIKDRLRDMHALRQLKKRQIKWIGTERYNEIQGRINFLYGQIDFSFKLWGVM